MKIITQLNRLIIMFLMLLLIGCSEGEKTKATKSQPKQDAKEMGKEKAKEVSGGKKQNLLKFNNLFVNAPSPYIMAKQINAANTKTKSSVLHNFEMARQYEDEKYQALNMGVFCADLIYSHVLETEDDELQFMAAMIYLSAELGLENIINTDVKERIQSAKNDKDKSMRIINDTYANLSTFLQEEGRNALASYIIAGGVTEVIFIASQLESDNNFIAELMAEQKPGVDALMDIFNKIKTEVDSDIFEDVHTIWEIYQGVEVEKTASDNKMADDGVLTIGKKERYTFSAQQLEKLKIKVAEIRSKYIE